MQKSKNWNQVMLGVRNELVVGHFTVEEISSDDRDHANTIKYAKKGDEK